MPSKSKPIDFRKITVKLRLKPRRYVLMVGSRELRTRFHENGFSVKANAEMVAYWLRRGAPKRKKVA